MLTWAPLAAATPQSTDLPRQPGFEQQFSLLHGSLQRVQLDSAGDVRLEVADNDDPGTPRVVAVIPQAEGDGPFCSAREALFDAMQVDPVEVALGTAPVWERDVSPGPHTFQPLVVDLIGRPFYDGEHCDANARRYDIDSLKAAATCWEISPVLQLSAMQAEGQEPEAAPPAPPASPPQVEAAIKDAAAMSGQDPSRFSVSKVQSVDWPDSSLGCPRPGVAYLMVITPGWLVELTDGRAIFEYHTDTGSNIILCNKR